MAEHSGSGLAIVIMGASGAGKSTTGKLLADALCCEFLDADNFHSKENIEKMRMGIPLEDSDRFPWLETLRNELEKYIAQGKLVVLACSALRVSYRNTLRDAGPTNWGPMRVVFVYLRGSYQLLAPRLEARFKDGQHYMPPSLLKSQLELVEMSPMEEDIVAVDLEDLEDMLPQSIVKLVVSKLETLNTSQRLVVSG